MLPNSEHSQSVCQAEGGLFANAPKDSLVIDCSTISPTVAIALNQAARPFGITYVDAPVSGGVTGSAAGTLTFMVGAENAATFERVKPFLECMGKSIFNCDKIGAGQIAKVCNNMALAIEMIGISEALALGAKLGMDQKILTNIMKVSSSRCWSVDTYNPVPGVMENVPAGRDYERGFACDLMLKDIKLALAVAGEVGCKTELGDKSKQIYEKISKDGYGRKDFGVVYDLIVKNKL
jgi:3-hydroxyisobutyrate dehydrogenase